MSAISIIERERSQESRPENLPLPLPPLSTTSAPPSPPSLRVRDLTGEIDLPRERTVHPVIVSPAVRGGKLTLHWYDYGVLALIAASVIAGVICLLHGV